LKNALVLTFVILQVFLKKMTKKLTKINPKKYILLNNYFNIDILVNVLGVLEQLSKVLEQVLEQFRHLLGLSMY